MNKDGKTGAGDFIVDPNAGVALRIDSISPVVDTDGLEALISEQHAATDNFLSLSPDQQQAATENSDPRQYNLVSIAPAEFANSPGFIANPDAPVAIDLDRDGTLSGGDILIDRANGDAMRVESVQSEPVIGLGGLEAEMEAHQNFLNGLTEAEASTLAEESEANRFDILGAESFPGASPT